MTARAGRILFKDFKIMQFLEVSRAGPISRIVLNRPEAMNALSPAMHAELAEAFDAFAADPEQLICVVTGAGDRAFCAGSDLKAIDDPAQFSYPKSGYAGIASRFDCPKPIIAAVNGAALGGGFELALACDIVIASERAVFSLPEPLVGAIALAGGLQRLARQIPLKQAMGAILTAKRITADEGLRMGFVNEIAPHDQLMDVTQRWCDEILRASPVAIQTSKTIVHRGLAEVSLEEAMQRQAGYPEFESWRTSADFQEGVKAFREKRRPVWTGA